MTTRRDWAFVVACIAGALLFGVWSFKLGLEFRRSQPGATDLSSSRRQRADEPPANAATRGAEPVREGQPRNP